MIKSLYKYRAYILYSVRAKLISKTIKNHLGVLWLLLDPILRMVVFYVVFVFLMHKRTENFTTFLLIGIVAFTWFMQGLTMGATSISQAGRLIQQIFIPKVVFPTITTLVHTIEFAIVISLLAIYISIRLHPAISWLALPAIMLTQFIFVYGVTLLSAAIVPFIPDLSFLISHGTRALFFLSGVFFEIKPTDPQYHLFMLNPLAKLLEQYRQILLHGRWPEWNSLLHVSCIGLVMILAGAFILEKFEHYYPRITA